MATGKEGTPGRESPLHLYQHHVRRCVFGAGQGTWKMPSPTTFLGVRRRQSSTTSDMGMMFRIILFTHKRKGKPCCLFAITLLSRGCRGSPDRFVRMYPVLVLMWWFPKLR